MAEYLPWSIALSALSWQTDGIEYAAGFHFGHNILVFILFPPFAGINAGLTGVISWIDIGYIFLYQMMELSVCAGAMATYEWLVKPVQASAINSNEGGYLAGSRDNPEAEGSWVDGGLEATAVQV